MIITVVDFTASTGATTPSVFLRSTDEYDEYDDATTARQCCIIIYYCKCK